MKNIYENVVSEMASSEKGRENLFLLCSCMANQVNEAETEEEREEKKKITRYLLWSVCLARRNQMKFFRSLIDILKPTTK